MTSQFMSRKVFKSREYLTQKIIVDLSSFCPQKPRVQPGHDCAYSVVNAREVTRDLNPMGSLQLHWLMDSSQGNFIWRDSSVFFLVSFNRKIARYGIVTVMFRSIAMDL